MGKEKGGRGSASMRFRKTHFLGPCLTIDDYLSNMVTACCLCRRGGSRIPRPIQHASLEARIQQTKMQERDNGPITSLLNEPETNRSLRRSQETLRGTAYTIGSSRQGDRTFTKTRQTSQPLHVFSLANRKRFHLVGRASSGSSSRSVLRGDNES